MLLQSRKAGQCLPALVQSLVHHLGAEAGALGSASQACRHLQSIATPGRKPLLRGSQLWWSRGMASYPPHTVLEMPALSPTMSQGNIAAWKKKEGEEIAAGDVLCEVETDKATMDWEAQDEGFLAKIMVSDGAKDISVGTPVAVVVEEQDSVDAFKDFEAGSGGGSESSGKEAAAASSSEPQEDEPQEEDEGEEEEEEVAESSGGESGNYPPHTLAGLPALSPTMSQGNIAKWNKKEGEEISAGDSIAEIETDKATMDWEAQDDGFVAKILVEEGAKDVGVGDPVLVIVEEQDSIEAFKDFSPGQSSKPTKKAPKKKPSKKPASDSQSQKESADKSEPTSTPQPSPSRSSGERVKASPYAQKLAREAGVDISQASPTGPEGRIVAADVEKLISSGGGKQADQKQSSGGKPAAETAQPASQAPGYTDFKDVPVAQIKKITAQRLLESKQTIPHYYLSIDCKVDKLIALRAQLNEALASSKAGGKLSVNDFVIKAAAQALKKVPQVNASWRGDFIREFSDINIGVAVQTDVGLLVPVLPKVETKGLGDISSGVKALATKARDNKLKPTDYDNGTFTISNLGMFGIEQFAAIINPPQAAILAVGATTKRVVAIPGGFGEASIMTVTLSCDHRVVDGAMGAIWLQNFRSNIEEPINMLL